VTAPVQPVDVVIPPTRAPSSTNAGTRAVALVPVHRGARI
jgi:hypothetical protein